MQALDARETHGADGVTDVPVHAIHRGGSGVIALATKARGEDWKQLGALPVGQPFLPELCRMLSQDGYFAVNASYGKPAARKHDVTRERWEPIPGEPHGEQLVTRTKTHYTRTHPETGLPYVEHSASTLRWLNVAYCDLDCYRLGLTVGDALGALVNMQDRGQIPPATLFARSGRGLWTFWFLIDTQNPATGEATVHKQQHLPWTSQRASDRAVRLYARVQGEIVRRLAHLGADLGAIDGPRYAPMPGTEKTTGDTRVMYWIQRGRNGPPAYTLAALATELGLETTTTEHPVILAAFPDAPVNPVLSAAGRRGHRQRWRYVLAELEALFALRGGYGDVRSRHQAAFYHAIALRRAGMNAADVETRVRRYWGPATRARGGDRLDDGDLQQVLRQAHKPKSGHHRLRRETYLAALHVTAAEQTYMDAIRPPVHAPAARDPQTRHQAIIDAIHQTFNGRVPPTRDMAAHLTAIGAHSGNHTTVWRDYRDLGLKPVGKPGRPPKLPL